MVEMRIAVLKNCYENIYRKHRAKPRHDSEKYLKSRCLVSSNYISNPFFGFRLEPQDILSEHQTRYGNNIKYTNE